MHYEEVVEIQTMGKELEPEERTMLKKDAWSKCGKGIILLIMLAVAVVAVILILLLMDRNDLYLRGRGVRRLAVLAIVALVSAIVYIFFTFKHSLTALVNINKIKMVEVREINIKELDKAGYKHYGEVTIRNNSVVQTIDVPIMRDSVKMVMWKRRGKLYFVPNKYYVLSKVDE